MKQYTKNILLLAVFLAAVMLIAWALPLWAGVGLVLIVQVVTLVIVVFGLVDRDRNKEG